METLLLEVHYLGLEVFYFILHALELLSHETADLPNGLFIVFGEIEDVCDFKLIYDVGLLGLGQGFGAVERGSEDVFEITMCRISFDLI